MKQERKRRNKQVKVDCERLYHLLNLEPGLDHKLLFSLEILALSYFKLEVVKQLFRLSFQLTYLQNVPQKMEESQRRKQRNMMNCLMPLHLCFLTKAYWELKFIAGKRRIDFLFRKHLQAFMYSGTLI